MDGGMLCFYNTCRGESSKVLLHHYPYEKNIAEILQLRITQRTYSTHVRCHYVLPIEYIVFKLKRCKIISVGNCNNYDDGES